MAHHNWQIRYQTVFNKTWDASNFVQLCCPTTWPASASRGPHRSTGTTSDRNCHKQDEQVQPQCNTPALLLDWQHWSAPVCGVFVQALIIVRWDLLYCNYLRHLLKSLARRRKMQRAVARECHRATIPHTWDPCVWTHTHKLGCVCDRRWEKGQAGDT